MSRAASPVPTCASRSLPALVLQAFANVLDHILACLTSVLVSGVGSADRYASMPSVPRHRTGDDAPTPRGSKLTTSNRRRSEADTAALFAFRLSTPEAPGPPKLSTRDPIFFP